MNGYSPSSSSALSTTSIPLSYRSCSSAAGDVASVFLIGGHIAFSEHKLGSVRSEPLSQQVCRQLDLLGFPEGTLPYCRYAPSVVEQRGTNSAVPNHIRFELRLPEICARRWRCGVTASFVMVPEAAVYKHSRAILREYEVGSSGKLPYMQPIPKMPGMQCLPKCPFRFCVLSPDPCHHPGTGLLVDYIRHACPGFLVATGYTPAE
jgi:hypothetical protein